MPNITKDITKDYGAKLLVLERQFVNDVSPKVLHANRNDHPFTKRTILLPPNIVCCRAFPQRAYKCFWTLGTNWTIAMFNYFPLMEVHSSEKNIMARSSWEVFDRT